MMQGEIKTPKTRKAPTKLVKTTLELPVWEAFYRLFPRQGERAEFLRYAVEVAIEHGCSFQEQNKETVARMIKQGRRSFASREETN